MGMETVSNKTSNPYLKKNITKFCGNDEVRSKRQVIGLQSWSPAAL